MMKKIVDDPNGGLRVTGTFIQAVYDLSDYQIKEAMNSGTEKSFFDYRIDSSNVKDQDVHVRRTKKVESGEKKGVRTTLDVSIPLEIESFLSAFPFQVSIATATIDLKSRTWKNDVMLRPNLLVHKKDPRQTISIRNNDTILSKFGQVKKNSNDLDQIIDIVDKAASYNVLSPYPEVYYEYEKDNENCQRFCLSFYVVKSGFDKVFSILLPMVLVSIVALLNVLNDDMNKEDATNHLQVSSALTLAIVFVLNDACNQDRLFNWDNINTVLYFLGLVLASVPKAIANSLVPEVLGVILMFLALLTPAWHCSQYFAAQRGIRAQAKISTANNQYLKDKSYAPNEELENFVEVKAVLDANNNKDALSEIKVDPCCYSARNDALWWKEGKEGKQKRCTIPRVLPRHSVSLPRHSEHTIDFTSEK